MKGFPNIGIPVPAGSTTEVDDDVELGFDPVSPELGLDGIRLALPPEDGGALVYDQTPIVPELWILRIDDQGWGVECTFTLIVRAEDLAP